MCPENNLEFLRNRERSKSLSIFTVNCALAVSEIMSTNQKEIEIGHITQEEPLSLSLSLPSQEYSVLIIQVKYARSLPILICLTDFPKILSNIVALQVIYYKIIK
jgi:hypothetical protein